MLQRGGRTVAKQARGTGGAPGPCPTCGQTPQAPRERRSDFDRGMDFWAARDAYRVQTVLGLLAIPLLVAGGVFVLQGVGWVVWMVGKWLGY